MTITNINNKEHTAMTDVKTKIIYLLYKKRRRFRSKFDHHQYIKITIKNYKQIY